jgi:glutamate synthase (NADPH/NADH) small chain
VLCAGACVYNDWEREPIQIGRLQRFATETALRQDPLLVARTRKVPTGKRIACIGAGPASLAAAGHLALDGHSVTIFEQKAIPGGLNTLGIAPYKLMAHEAIDEIDFIRGLGDVRLMLGHGVVAGAAKPGQVSAKTLLDEYDAVFIGVGLGSDGKLGVHGEDGPGVHGATALIERIKSDPTLEFDGVEHAVVVGGGNTAIDIARELRLLGVREVTMIYRRDAAEMSGYDHEMAGGRKEGVRLVDRRKPVGFVRDAAGALTGIRVVPSDARDDAQGAEVIPCDLCAVAIGQARLTGLAAAFPGVALDAAGRIVVDLETCRTGNARVYAGGDCVNGGKEVVNAAQHGKLAARAITQTLAASAHDGHPKSTHEAEAGVEHG